MANTEVSICNQALGRIGAKPPIQSLTEKSENARQCNTFYASVRDAVLRSHPWNCAIHRSTITALAETPDSDYDNQFQLPTNPWCLRMLQVGTREDRPIEWRVEGRRLLTNEDRTPIVYIKRITDTNEFDALLVDALVLKLALKIVMPLTSSAVIQKSIIDELEGISLPEARSIDGQESSVRRFETNDWLNSRF